jgi:phospho-N-acetylmuramoyl-pentapeptide-transferase
MLYFLLVPLKDYFFFFNVFRYITVRTALAGITALIISFILGPWLIKKLKKYQIGEEIRPEGPQSHFEKKGTPSMGGILIIASTLIPTLLWGNLSNIYVLVTMFGINSFSKSFWLDLSLSS